jgi:23S rRNA-/tRNA-specific pseudouridylate synthase
MGMENYNPPQEPWLVILYQDDHIMVVNKPSGLLSVPGRLEEHKDSVMTRIQRDYPQAESVHRLDMATSGVIVVALTKAAERELKRQFRAEKTVCGPRLGASIPCGRSGGSAADLRLAKPPETESLLRNR